MINQLYYKPSKTVTEMTVKGTVISQYPNFVKIQLFQELEGIGNLVSFPCVNNQPNLNSKLICTLHITKNQSAIVVDVKDI